MAAKRITSAIIGSTLITLLLTGSTRTAAVHPIDASASLKVARLNSEGKKFFKDARFQEARDSFRSAAVLAHSTGDERAAAMNWSNAGVCSTATLQFRKSLDDFTLARRIAEASHEMRPLISALNNIASLYIHMGQPENALNVAKQALAGPAGHADPGVRAMLFCQIGQAFAEMKNLSEADHFYREGIRGLIEQKDLEGAARAWGMFGNDNLRAGRVHDAESALNEGFRLVRTQHLKPSASILSGLAKIKSLQGDSESAAKLFDAALAAPPNLTPRWVTFADRARFRLQRGDSRAALADFRESRRIATELRANIVPADQDRVALETGLSLNMQGLVDAGNRVVQKTGDRATLEETFDAAENDRLWSLRELVPGSSDWRTRLPEHYWELLARYQDLERAALTRSSPEGEAKASTLRLELQQIEANASKADSQNSGSLPNLAESPFAHVRKVVNPDTVLLSFHVTKTSSWIWALDSQAVGVYPLPPMLTIEAEVKEFAGLVRNGGAATPLGRRIYHDLFGAVPEKFLRHTLWLLEPDGPLYDLPFAALVAGQDNHGPIYLVERKALQSVPSALLLRRGAIPADGEFLGIGDPVYNRADSRFQGTRGKSDLALPRLPNTAGELQACALAWNSPQPNLLLGSDARLPEFRRAMNANPSIVHFATHVVSSTGEFRSGLIALGLDATGAMGLLGPKEIIARPVTASLVVMDGCHSAQGETLPSAGLMGLTRAWIGAGAQAVMATQWDVPDEAAQSFMTDFYGALRTSNGHGAAFALRKAQIAALNKPGGRQSATGWAGYFLLSRIE